MTYNIGLNLELFMKCYFDNEVTKITFEYSSFWQDVFFGTTSNERRFHILSVLFQYQQTWRTMVFLYSVQWTGVKFQGQIQNLHHIEQFYWSGMQPKAHFEKQSQWNSVEGRCYFNIYLKNLPALVTGFFFKNVFWIVYLWYIHSIIK